MLTITQCEVWEDAFVRTYWPFNPDSGAPDLRPLIPVKKYNETEYTRMMHKLLPRGRIWEDN